MSKSTKSRAEEQFAAAQRKDRQGQMEKAAAQQERAAHQAKLRGLRLAKEAADKAAANGADA